MASPLSSREVKASTFPFMFKVPSLASNSVEPIVFSVPAALTFISSFVLLSSLAVNVTVLPLTSAAMFKVAVLLLSVSSTSISTSPAVLVTSAFISMVSVAFTVISPTACRPAPAMVTVAGSISISPPEFTIVLSFSFISKFVVALISINPVPVVTI